MVEPFVYPEHLAPQAIDEVRRVKVRIEEYVRARGKAGVEVKRGWGGIRDVEFAVQLLQIVHGRRDVRLREPNTLRALAVLAAEGYVADPDAGGLAEAYRFLRTLEHRLQIVRDLQTHDLPADRASRTALARSLGLDGADALRSEYQRQTTLVRGLHERLFYRPLLEAFAGPPAPRPGVDREATEELLEGLGFARPQASYDVLGRLVEPTTRMGKVLAHIFPVMAPGLALSADPDAFLAMASPGSTPDGIPSLEGFPVPVLLVMGEFEDEEGDAARVAAATPHGESLVLPGLGHMGAFDRSDLVLPTARAFLDRWFA